MLGGQETAPFAITGHTSGVVNGSDVVVFGGHHANNTRNRAYVLKYPSISPRPQKNQTKVDFLLCRNKVLGRTRS